MYLITSSEILINPITFLLNSCFLTIKDYTINRQFFNNYLSQKNWD